MSCCLPPKSAASPTQYLPAGILVYTNALSSSPGPEWSTNSIAVTPKGQRHYLGDFRKEAVTLSLNHLPEHRLLRVSFDLYLMRSWDGSSKYWGQCFWDFGVVNGASLIHTTFGNCGFFCDNNEQAFPDNWPCGPHPAWTGSVEHQTLGVIQSWGGPERTFDCSSVYHFDLAFPHNGEDVSLLFKGTPMTNPKKPWGLCNVRVEAVPSLVSYSDSEFTNLWEKLADPDPVKAFDAKWQLVAGGESTAARISTIQDGAVLATDISTNVNHVGESLETLRLHRARYILDIIAAANTPPPIKQTNILPIPAVAIGNQPIRVGLATMINHQFAFHAEGLSGQRTAVVEASTDLQNWQPILTNTTPGTNLDLSIPISPDWPARFFRVVEQ